MSMYIKAGAFPVQADAEVNLEGLIIRSQNGKVVVWPKEKIHKNIQKESDSMIILFGDEPADRFETNDAQIISKLKSIHAHYGFKIQKKNSVFYGKSGFLVICFTLVLLIVGFYTYGLNWMAKGVAAAIPIDTEESIGQSLYDQTVDAKKINSNKTKLINEFFKELHYRSDYYIKITIIDSSMINAFALPGGNIIVMSGIIDQMESYDELAALIGHELTHINEKHVTRSLVRTAGAYILISAVIGDVTGIAAAVAENADALRSLKFSRDLETDADEKGLEQMQEQKLNLNGMLKLFERLKKAEQQQAPPEFLSTHPATDERIGHVKELITNRPQVSVKNEKLEALFKEIKSLH